MVGWSVGRLVRWSHGRMVGWLGVVSPIPQLVKRIALRSEDAEAVFLVHPQKIPFAWQKEASTGLHLMRVEPIFLVQRRVRIQAGLDDTQLPSDIRP